MPKPEWLDEPLEAEPLVRVRRRRPAARAQKRLPAPVYGALVAGSERGQTDRRQRGRVRASSASPRTSPASRPSASMATTVMGQEISLPVIISPDRRAGRPPRRRGRRGPGRRGPRHGHGAEQLRQPSRSRRSSRPNPTTFFQMYWTGDRDVMVQRMERARAAGAVGPDRHPGLVVLDGPRLGQPRDPREGRPQDHGPDGAPGRSPGRAGSTSSAAPARSPT